MRLPNFSNKLNGKIYCAQILCFSRKLYQFDFLIFGKINLPGQFFFQNDNIDYYFSVCFLGKYLSLGAAKLFQEIQWKNILRTSILLFKKGLSRKSLVIDFLILCKINLPSQCVFQNNPLITFCAADEEYVAAVDMLDYFDDRCIQIGVGINGSIIIRLIPIFLYREDLISLIKL